MEGSILKYFHTTHSGEKAHYLCEAMYVKRFTLNVDLIKFVLSCYIKYRVAPCVLLGFVRCAKTWGLLRAEEGILRQKKNKIKKCLTITGQSGDRWLCYG